MRFSRRLLAAAFQEMTKTALVIVAEGSEEMEAVITIDVLRRAGLNVTVAGLSGDGVVKCSRSVLLKPDQGLEQVKSNKYDALVLPGGKVGTDNLAASKLVGELSRCQYEEGRLLAAICAAPLVLKANEIAKSGPITSHPSVKQELLDAGFKYSEERVVTSGNLVTSRGPGTAFEFALKLVEILIGQEKVAEISPPMILK